MKNMRKITFEYATSLRCEIVTVTERNKKAPHAGALIYVLLDTISKLR